MVLEQVSHHIYKIDNFLSDAECSDFIEYSEQQGFADADVFISAETRQHLTNIRNNSRVDYYSENLANKWWKILEQKPLPTVSGAKAIGLSPCLRFYRYEPGQKFNMHKDGEQSVNGHQTLCTLLVYLNADYRGGETLFRDDNIAVEPKSGTMLLFEHRLWHKGNPVISGIKYVLRTDIIFNRIDLKGE